MKIVHVPFVFYPDPVGGTEVYVAALATALTRQGHPSIVAAPGSRDALYNYEGLLVHRFAVSDRIEDASEVYGDGDAGAAKRFGRILDREQPDIVHLHAFTRACSVMLAREAKQRRIPLVFTYHTPTVSCQRGTLMEWGQQPCDGEIRVARCTGCTLQGLGVNPAGSRVLARMPIAIGSTLGAAGLRGGVWTALRMSSLIDRRAAAAAQLFAMVDRFVALTPWVHAVLTRNGVPEERIVASPHGIPPAAAQEIAVATPRAGKLRIAHLGRLDPVKGTALLIRALRRVPDAPLTVDIFGILQDGRDVAVLAELRRLAHGDSRLRFLPAVEHATVVHRLAEYDVLAVPSQWMETGPLVVLEAFAAGIPVLVSALGGLAEKVTDGVNGLLVTPHDSIDAWGAALKRCAEDRELMLRLRPGIRRPRSVTDVADDMLTLYRDLVPGSRSDAVATRSVVRAIGG